MRLIPPKSIVTFSRDPISDDQNLNRILTDFVSELSGEKPGKDIVLRALVEQTLVHILRNYATPKRSEELELSRVGLVDRRIRRSVELMYTQLDQDLTLKALAAASYLSPFHFARLFKKTHRLITAQLSRRHSRHARAVATRRNRSFGHRNRRAGRLSKRQPFYESIPHRHRRNSARISPGTRLAKQRRRNTSPIMRKICRFKSPVAHYDS